MTPDRKLLAATAVFFALIALIVPRPADAVLYRGGGERLRVEFRIAHDVVRFARIRTSEFCLDRRSPHRRHRRAVDAVWGNFLHRRPPPTANVIYSFMLHVEEGHIAQHDFSHVPDYTADRLGAYVTRRRVVGSFLEALTAQYPGSRGGVDCRTDRYWRAGSGSSRTRPLRFVAHRVSG